MSTMEKCGQSTAVDAAGAQALTSPPLTPNDRRPTNKHLKQTNNDADLLDITKTTTKKQQQLHRQQHLTNYSSAHHSHYQKHAENMLRMPSSSEQALTPSSPAAGPTATGSVALPSPVAGAIPSAAASMNKDEKLIAELRQQIPDIDHIFNMHHRIGEGTFSTVFLASLKSHAHVPEHERKLFAVKHLIPTSHPNRVERELKCLLEIGGTDNVVGVDLCLRRLDAVAFVMPYVQHDKFTNYFNLFDARELQLYMRNLLLALRRVHSFGVIHRDVKPSNFLHDRKTKKYLLVDFGLAQNVRRTSDVQHEQQIEPHSSTIASATTPTTVATSDRKIVAAGSTRFTHSDLTSSLGQGASSGTGAQLRPAVVVSPPTHPNLSSSLNHLSSNSQSVVVMKKRKAAEIEETENHSETVTTTKRPRHQLNHQHHHNHNQQYFSAGTTDGMPSTSRLPANQNEMPKIGAGPRTTGGAATEASDAQPPAGPVGSALPVSPFKTPLKQFNEISTPKNSLRSHRFGSALTSHVKSAVIGYSITAKLTNSPTTISGVAGSPSPSRGKHPIGVPPSAAQPPKYLADNRRTSRAGDVACYCYGKPTICNVCIIKKEVHASRAGTPGYRPPEVLLKNPAQTTAVDMWAIGVIMISIMSACYPFFKGNDDVTALAEIITIFGDETIKKTAASMSRRICNSQKKRPLHLRKLCIRLRNRSATNTISTMNRSAVTSATPSVRHSLCENCQQISPECLCSNSPLNMDFSADIFPESAYDLMSKLLAINPAQRISADEALRHPFLWADL